MQVAKHSASVLSVVVINYNRFSDLRECLFSLPKDEGIEVLVVDNCSPDVGIERIQADYEFAHFILLTENVGYAKACNIGIAAASTEVILLLNNDTVLAPTVHFAPVLEAFRHSPQLAAVQPAILIYNEERINACGLDINYLGFSWCTDYRKLRSELPSGKQIAAFSGAAVFLRRSAVQSVNGFDDDYFMYHEDVDLSLRLRLENYQLAYLPDTIVYHKYSYKSDSQKYFYLERNRLMTLLKNYSVRSLLCILPAFIAMEIGMVIFSIFDGWIVKKMHSYFSILKELPKVVGKRKVVAHVLADRAFFAPIVGRINFQEVENFYLRLANPLFAFYWRIVKFIA